MNDTHTDEKAQPWRPVPGHAPTELADIFGGYLCECGESWSWLHDSRVRPYPPEGSER